MYFKCISAFPSPCGEKVGINPDSLTHLRIFEEDEFPSPCGEKVGINSVYQVTVFKHLVSFPSPCGEKVGINAGRS